MNAPLGFRVCGGPEAERRLCDWRKAFMAYAGLDALIDPAQEAYLSAFCFGNEFREHMNMHGTPRGFVGPCGGEWLWVDLDGDNGDIAAPLDGARRITSWLETHAAADLDKVLSFFSGSKGVHLGLPVAGLGDVAPCPAFNRIARRFCERIATEAGAVIDSAIYDKVRIFRAPNSRHPKTGLHKRRLPTADLIYLSVEQILAMAATPEPFDIPEPGVSWADWTLPGLWAEAREAVDRAAVVRNERKAASAGAGAVRLARSTLDFIKSGAPAGDRHRALFAAAANLAEFDTVDTLIPAILEEAALDSGLPPREVERQIYCGIEHARKGAAAC